MVRYKETTPRNHEKDAATISETLQMNPSLYERLLTVSKKLQDIKPETVDNSTNQEQKKYLNDVVSNLENLFINEKRSNSAGRNYLNTANDRGFQTTRNSLNDRNTKHFETSSILKKP